MCRPYDESIHSLHTLYSPVKEPAQLQDMITPVEAAQAEGALLTVHEPSNIASLPEAAIFTGVAVTQAPATSTTRASTSTARHLSRSLAPKNNSLITCRQSAQKRGRSSTRPTNGPRRTPNVCALVDSPMDAAIPLGGLHLNTNRAKPKVCTSTTFAWCNTSFWKCACVRSSISKVLFKMLAKCRSVGH